jgi:hypothetical protein
MPNRRRPARRPTARKDSVPSLSCTSALLLSLAALSTLLPAGAHAQSSPYYIGLLQTVSSESNVVRLRDGQVPPDGISKTDLIYSTAVVGGINQTIGRQRLFGNASLRDTRFDKNKQYSSQGYAVNLGLDWSTVERVSGSLSLVANRTPRSAIRDRNENIIVERNVERLEGFDASVRVGLVTRLSAEASYNQRKLRYSAASSAFREYEQREGSLGLSVRPGAATTFGLGVAQRRTEYPSLLAFLIDPRDQRTRDSAYFSVRWAPTGISTVDARIDRGKVKHDPLPARDFSATTGTLGWTWRPGGRFSLQTRYTRDTGQDTEALTSAFSRTTDRYRLSATYDLSAKIRFEAGATTYRRLQEGNGLLVTGISGRDRGELFNLGVRWAPTRWLSLGCTYNTDKRRANSNPVLDDRYSANTFGCNAQAVLQ